MKACFLILLIALFSCGCTGDPPPQPDPVPLNPTFKEWCAFQPGTWWTYKEINTNLVDSFWVSSYSEEPQEGVDNFWYIQMGMDVNSANDTFGVHQYVGVCSDIDHDLWALVESALINQGRTTLNRFNYTISPPFDIGNNTTQIELDSVVLSSGSVFYTVVKVENQAPLYYNWIKAEYFVKHIGVIRREMFSGQIWELTGHHIVQ